MKKKFKIGVIGAGYMSTSIMGSAIRSKALKKNQLLISDVNDSQLEKFAKLGVKTTKDNQYLANNCEFVFFAVKPQNLTDLLTDIKNCSCEKFISIMAGVKKSRIKEVFPNGLIARCMPNAPCAVGSGVVGVDWTDFTDNIDVDFIKSIFNCSSEVVAVNEDLLNAVTGIGGSAPAYYYLFAKGLIDAGIKHGLTEEQSKLIAVNTMLGSAKMLLNVTDKSIEELIDSVCSKGGTTIEAIKIFNEQGLSELTDKAVDACVKRSFDLENV